MWSEKKTPTTYPKECLVQAKQKQHFKSRFVHYQIINEMSNVLVGTEIHWKFTFEEVKVIRPSHVDDALEIETFL